ncbi:RNA helicase [Paucisalibacillus globulus]|uniref:RNA helicase n=1 Tax=Paucisalibacillus globulus TaxID=351095 RepID=UPI000BB9B310|nr:RNA helicase [Paucisalibacillus globulus]
MVEAVKEVVKDVAEEVSANTKECGIIMPIAAMNNYSAEHWVEVKNIIVQATESIDGIKFNTKLVSNSDGEVDVIHKRIIQNIYNSDIVVCDISGRNPNVLFELGMRLTFDKPTILIKDDVTDFIFDTGVIEHITYPRDLRYGSIVKFKKELSNRIKLTYEKAKSDNNFSTFLGNFGEFKVPSLNQTTVSDVNQLILDELGSVRKEISNIKKESLYNKNRNSRGFIPVNLKNIIKEYFNNINPFDFDKPSIIIQKEEFNSFLKDKNIDPYAIQNDVLIKYIEDAQSDDLPF